MESAVPFGLEGVVILARCVLVVCIYFPRRVWCHPWRSRACCLLKMVDGRADRGFTVDAAGI